MQKPLFDNSENIAAWIVHGGNDVSLKGLKPIDKIYAYKQMHEVIEHVVDKLPKKEGIGADVFNRLLDVSEKIGLNPRKKGKELGILETFFEAQLAVKDMVDKEKPKRGSIVKAEITRSKKKSLLESSRSEGDISRSM